MLQVVLLFAVGNGRQPLDLAVGFVAEGTGLGIFVEIATQAPQDCAKFDGPFGHGFQIAALALQGSGQPAAVALAIAKETGLAFERAAPELEQLIQRGVG